MFGRPRIDSMDGEQGRGRQREGALWCSSWWWWNSSMPPPVKTNDQLRPNSWLVFSKLRSWIPWPLAVTGHFPSYTWTFYRVEESGSRLMTRSPFFVLHFPVSMCASLVCRPLIVNQLSSCMPASLSRPGLDQFISLSRPTRQPSTLSFTTGSNVLPELQRLDTIW